MKDITGRQDDPQSGWSIADLRKAGDDERTPVPEGFRDELSEMLDSMDAAEHIASPGRSGAKRIVTWVVSSAAALVLIAGAALAVNTYRSPEDTFSDPALAYAQAEKALSDISARMSSCAGKTIAAEASVGKQIEMIRSVYSDGED